MVIARTASAQLGATNANRYFGASSAGWCMRRKSRSNLALTGCRVLFTYNNTFSFHCSVPFPSAGLLVFFALFHTHQDFFFKFSYAMAVACYRTCFFSCADLNARIRVCYMVAGINN